MPGCSFVLALVWTSFLVQVICVGCIRIPKESIRLKSKCFANISLGLKTEALAVSRHPRCVVLNHPYCLDLKLPYNETLIPEHITDLNLRSSQEVDDYLEQWRGVQKIPRCWPILRVALCSLLMPQCEEADATMLHYQPSVDICHDLFRNNHCKFIERHLIDWPNIFNCSNSRNYAKNCSNELRELKYAKSINQKPTCQYPLVSSNEERNFFSDISGCALHCKYPITNSDEQANIKHTISILCLLGLTSTITALILYSVNRADGRPSRMAKVVKHCTICQLLFYIGWSLQFFSNHELGCRPDGSALYGQPLVANLCVLSFLLTYLPSLSSLLWCAHLGKLFHENRQVSKRDEQEKSTKLDRTLSLYIYGIPLALFVSVVFLGQIDGQGQYGICTVGQESIITKTAFVFVPTLIGTIYGNYYFLRIVVDLAFTEENKMNPSLKRNFIRMSALSTLTILQIIFEIANFYYEHTNQEQWLSSIESYVACQLDLPYATHRSDNSYQNVCRIANRPVVTPYYLEILSKLGIGLVISSWIYSESNYRGLVRKFVDLIENEEERRNRVLKHKHDLDPTTNNFDTLRQATELDLIDMNVKTRQIIDQSIEQSRQTTEQYCLMPPDLNKLPAPDPMVVMQMLLMNSETMMKMQSKTVNHGNLNESSTPNFTHALHSNPAPAQSDLYNFQAQRRASMCLSERSSIGSIQLNMSGTEESNSLQNIDVSTKKRRKLRLPRKKHKLLIECRSSNVVRDARKLYRQRQQKNNDLAQQEG